MDKKQLLSELTKSDTTRNEELKNIWNKFVIQEFVTERNISFTVNVGIQNEDSKEIFSFYDIDFLDSLAKANGFRTDKGTYHVTVYLYNHDIPRNYIYDLPQGYNVRLSPIVKDGEYTAQKLNATHKGDEPCKYNIMKYFRGISVKEFQVTKLYPIFCEASGIYYNEFKKEGIRILE